MDATRTDSAQDPRRRSGLKVILLAGAAALAFTFPMAALAQGWHGGHGGGHMGGHMGGHVGGGTAAATPSAGASGGSPAAPAATPSSPTVQASTSHGNWDHGGGSHHGGGWHNGSGHAAWHHGGWHHGGWRGGIGWGFGAGVWDNPVYDYRYDWNYPSYAPPPNYYGAAPGYYTSTWYYCPNPAGYYPYVTQCYGPWQTVPAG